MCVYLQVGCEREQGNLKGVGNKEGRRIPTIRKQKPELTEGKKRISQKGEEAWRLSVWERNEDKV